MTSARKLEANRRNARASTGPWTAAGKARAAQNARRHGLSLAALCNPSCAGEVEALAGAIAGADAGLERLGLARAIAGAQIDVMRARSARTRFIPRRWRAMRSRGSGPSPATSGAPFRAAMPLSGSSIPRPQCVPITRAPQRSPAVRPNEANSDRSTAWPNEANRNRLDGLAERSQQRQVDGSAERSQTQRWQAPESVINGGPSCEFGETNPTQDRRFSGSRMSLLAVMRFLSRMRCSASACARVVHRWSGTVASSECAKIPGLHRITRSRVLRCARETPDRRRAAFWPEQSQTQSWQVPESVINGGFANLAKRTQRKIVRPEAAVYGASA